MKSFGNNDMGDASHRRARRSNRQHCTHDRRFKLLTLNKIMDLETRDDITFSLKVLASAFEIATEVIASDHGDLELRSDVISICESNIRHGHRLILEEKDSII